MSVADPTDDDLEVAKALRAAVPPWSWDRIACHLAVSQYRLRCRLEIGYYERQTAGVRKNRAKRRLNAVKQPRQKARVTIKTVKMAPGQICPPNTGGYLYIPHEVLIDRDRRRLMEPRDFTSAFMGDPLPGMSALDRRGNG